MGSRVEEVDQKAEDISASFRLSFNIKCKKFVNIRGSHKCSQFTLREKNIL